MYLKWLTAVLLSLCPCSLVTADAPTAPIVLDSPDGQVRVTFRLDEQRRPLFEVAYRELTVVSGRLGLVFLHSGPLESRLKVVGARRASCDETYQIAVGKASSARDEHHELVVTLEETSLFRRRFDIAFRAFNDGVAFRYIIPMQNPLANIVLTDELTRLHFPGNPTAHLLPLQSSTTSYEAYYETSPVSAISSQQLLGLPLLLERVEDNSKRVWVGVTEASLTDYAGMYLARSSDGEPGTLISKLSPLPGRLDGAKVVAKAPHASPWRVLMIADEPGRLIESHIVFHLNDPPAISDTSWIKPGKTTFPWWNHYVLEGVDFEPGVNTATMKYYIDFCAEQGIAYHTLDGLDIAWYGGPIQPEGPTDVTKAAPSIDLPEVLRYAKSKGVRLRLWLHWKALQPQLDEAFALYEKMGIEGVMVDFMDRDDQEMVRWYHQVAQKAAEHHLTVTWHGAYKPTGMERTWPNVLTYEAVLNQEYNKWQVPGMQGTPPAHNLEVPFVRMLAGPLDYHQGGMRNVLPEAYRASDSAPPVQGTRGHQLAMYVVYQNHLPMLADYPSAYRGQPELKFLVNVPSRWDETRVLYAEVGQCIVVARRQGETWYIGGMTAGQERKFDLPLSFLGNGSFDGVLYSDDPLGGPSSVTRSLQPFSATDTLPVVMPPSGGFAAQLAPNKQVIGSPSDH